MPKIIKAGKVLTSEALNSEIIQNENIRKSNEDARNVWEDYNPDKTYIKGNKVVYNGSSYLCLASCKGIIPTSSTVYWKCISAAGGTITNASQLPITDTGSYYTADDVNSALQESGQRIGDLSNLQTSTHADLVSAINENASKLIAIPNQTYITEKAKTVDVNASLIAKADKTYVDSQIASISDGTPESFVNLAAITTAYPTGSNYVKLNLEDKYVYKWNGTQWVIGWSYQASGITDNSISTNKIVDNAVTLQKTSFAYQGKNLYDYEGRYQNKTFVLTNNGGYVVSLTDNVNYDASDFIYVTPGKTIYFSNNGKNELNGIATHSTMVYAFDINKGYVSRITTEPTTYTVPSGVYYIRILVNHIFTKFQAEYDKITYYEPYCYKFARTSYLTDRSVYESSKEFVPDYWESTLNTKIATIQSLMLANGLNKFSFGFITDTHWRFNAKHSYALLDKLLRECNIEYLLMGGDYISGGEASELVSETELRDHMNYWYDMNKTILPTVGNHDNRDDGKVTSDKIYSLIFRQLGNTVSYGEDGTYYYYDDKYQKIRFIVLNSMDYPLNGNAETGYRQVQTNWFCNTALNIPNDSWSIIVCTHIPPYSSTDFVGTGTQAPYGTENIMGVLMAFKNKTTFSSSMYPSSIWANTVNVDFTGKGGNVIAFISGHCHYDNFKKWSNSIPVITSVCDSWFDSGNGATAKVIGTITEQAFDVFTVDKTNRTVSITRIGAGNDRSFTY